MSKTYFNLASGSFQQNWSNAGLITTNNNWSGVPSIEGFQGQNIVTTAGANAGAALTDSALPGDLFVIANQVNPASVFTGGVAEFELADPTIAMQGSGVADAPHIVLYLDATGRENVTLSFNARDIDGNGDNAVQQIAVQYRIGETGPWTNLPPSGQSASTPQIADATTGPNAATLVTPVIVVLPSDANNQSQVQIRILTTNAVDNDEWVGIDDINVSSVQSSPVNTVPGPQSVNEDTTLAVTGVSVADDSSSVLATTLAVLSGTLNVTLGTGATVGGNGTGTVTIAGTAAEINAALAGLTYRGNLDFNGSETLTVATSDGTATDTDAVAITVNAVDDAPVAGNDAAAGSEDTAITTGNVLANDTDVDSTLTPASISAFSQGTHGTVAHNGDGTFTYTPNADFNGTDSFTYTLNDGAGGSDTATVSITVDPVDDPAVAENDAVATNENTVMSTGSLFVDNGSGPDSDPDSAFSVTEVTAGMQFTLLSSGGTVGTQLTLPSGALLTVNPDGTFSYDPNHQFDYLPAPGSGASNLTVTETFSYSITGGDTATVTVTVGGVDSNDVLLDSPVSTAWPVVSAMTSTTSPTPATS